MNYTNINFKLVVTLMIVEWDQTSMAKSSAQNSRDTPSELLVETTSRVSP